MAVRMVFLVCLVACGRAPGAVATTEALPLTVLDPAENPSSWTKVELGRLLFWDPILSGDRDTACATCHHPSFGYADGRALSIGTGGTGLGPKRSGGQATKRNAPTVLNTAFNGITGDTLDQAPASAPMFWDNRVSSLENQARGPITAQEEMRGAHVDETQIFPEIEARLSAIPEYVARFANAFPGGAISEEHIVQAIAAFERTLVDNDTSYDRFQAGNPAALSAAAQRGLATFKSAGCASCHAGAMFSDFKLHQIGVRSTTGDNGPMRTGSLRNITRTGPYMHNGSLATLDDVLNFYRGRGRGSNDPLLRNLRVPRGPDAQDLKAFLAALSDGTFDSSIPASVPSGLVPGGSL